MGLPLLKISAVAISTTSLSDEPAEMIEWQDAVIEESIGTTVVDR